MNSADWRAKNDTGAPANGFARCAHNAHGRAQGWEGVDRPLMHQSPAPSHPCARPTPIPRSNPLRFPLMHPGFPPGGRALGFAPDPPLVLFRSSPFGFHIAPPLQACMGGRQNEGSVAKALSVGHAAHTLVAYVLARSGGVLMDLRISDSSPPVVAPIIQDVCLMRFSQTYFELSKRLGRQMSPDGSPNGRMGRRTLLNGAGGGRRLEALGDGDGGDSGSDPRLLGAVQEEGPEVPLLARRRRRAPGDRAVGTGARWSIHRGRYTGPRTKVTGHWLGP